MIVNVDVTESGVSVTIEDDVGYNPDVLDDVVRRAGDQAIRVYRDLNGRKRKS